MTEFKRRYLQLLQRQVDEEIAYLISNGHGSDTVATPCIFCIEKKSGKYTCYRLNELKHFQSSLITHDKTEYPRKRMGYSVSQESGRENVLGTFDIKHEDLPLISTAI